MNLDKLEYLKSVRKSILELRDLPMGSMEYRYAIADKAFGFLNTVIAELESEAEGEDKTLDTEVTK